MYIRAVTDSVWGVMSGSEALNAGVVGDVAKLLMHRLIARKLRRDPTIIERAKVVHVRQADQFACWSFVGEWDELLALPPAYLVPKLISRDREMVRLRNSSPFYLVEDLPSLRFLTPRISHISCYQGIVIRGVVAHRRQPDGTEKSLP